MLRTKCARASAIVAAGVVASSVGVIALTGGAVNEAVGASAVIGGTCTGQVQHLIASDATVAGHKGWWAVARITDGLTTPYDAATGQITGRHLEQGVRMTMAANPATIGLLNAETTNETLTSCTFTFYRPSATGILQAYFLLKLTNAHVVSYGLNGSPTMGTTSDFAFTAQRIQRTWLIGNKTSIDDWNPVG